MTFAMADITTMLGGYLWVFARVGGMFMVMPVFGSRMIPRRIRLVAAIVVAAAITPAVPPPVIDPLSITSGIVMVHQILIGVVAGFVMRLVFEAFTFGGQLLARQSGLGFAMLVDPQSGVNVPLVSQIYLMSASLIFLALNGHLLMFEMLTESFKALPIGTTGLDPIVFKNVVLWAKWLFAVGVVISLPGVIALLLVYISLGVMTKAAPQLNIFAIGFAITLILGSVAMYLTLPLVKEHIVSHIHFGLQYISTILSGGS